MLLIGHRGCSYSGYNQNTLRAFEKVTREGIPAIELDVQLCSDGQLVIVHNLDLAEVSNGEGKVSTTHSIAIKSLYAGDPNRGKDRIPFLSEVFDYFASVSPDRRPRIHLELKGTGTGVPAGKLLRQYINSGRLQYSDVLASSFHWQELENIRSICPSLEIALLAGAMRRQILLEKIVATVTEYFEEVFSYGGEEYMLPRFNSVEKNLELLQQTSTIMNVEAILGNEVTSCLQGDYYTDELLSTAVEMNAVSVNLWYQTLTPHFIQKAHKKNLKVFAYTVNKPSDIYDLAQKGVDGIFTDHYSQAKAYLKKNLSSFS